VLALAARAEAPLAWIAKSGPRAAADVVLIAPWGEPARERLRALAGDRKCIDLSASLGDALAAAPSLAWAAALDLVASGAAARALVLSLGIDGELCAVELWR
jgi:hypothetical protein